MWYITKIKTGIKIGTNEPKNKSFIKLSSDTPDSVLYSLGCDFEALLKFAKKIKKDQESYVIRCKEVK